MVLKGLLDTYALVSGQVINYEKSSLTFSKRTCHEKWNQIQALLGVAVVEKHDKYLGMLATVGRSKKEVFGFFKERIRKRINGWGEKFQSSAGREVMIKAVLQAISSYIMSCFIVAWVAWKKMCQPKSSGGLGFKDIRSFNLALLAKQGWRLITKPYSLLAQVYKARYFPNGDFMTANLGNRPSATWRDILHARVHLLKGLRYRVGNGNGISLWADPWIPDDGNFHLITPRPIHSGFPYAVSDFIDPITQNWNKELMSEHVWEVDKIRILNIPIKAATSRDRLIWHYSKNGSFTVSSCYHMIFA